MAKTLAQQIQIFSDNINNHIDSSFNSLNEKIDGIEISKVPTKTSELVNDSSFLTKHQSLENYYTKSESDSKFQPKGNYLTEHQDLSQYALKTDLKKVPTKTSELVNDSGFLTKHQDLSSYAKKDEVYTKDNVDSIATRINNNKQDTLVSGVSIKTINGQDLLGDGDLKIQNDSSIDLSDYYTKEKTNSQIETSIATTLNNKHYLTEHQKLKTINGQSIIGSGNIQIDVQPQIDLSGYVTEVSLNNKGFLTKSVADQTYQVKGNYALKTELPDMSEYAKKTDIKEPETIDTSSFISKNDASNFVTNTELESKHYLTEHQELKTINGTSLVGTGNIQIDISQTDLSKYYTIKQVDNLLTKKQDTGDYVTNDELNKKGYLTEHQSLADYAKKSELPTDFYNKLHIDSSYNNLQAEIDSKQDAFDLSVYAKKTDLPDTTPFLTKTSATQTYQFKGDYALKSDVAKINLDNYYNKDQIDALTTITNQKLASKQNTLVSGTNIKTINGNSLLGEGDINISTYLSNYALKSDIPTDFYSKSYIDSSYNSLDTKIDTKQDKGDYALKSDIPTIVYTTQDNYNKMASYDDNTYYVIVG